MSQQLSQIKTVINHMEENRLAMKRLTEMMSHLLDNQSRVPTNAVGTAGTTREWFKQNRSISDDDQSKKMAELSYQRE